MKSAEHALVGAVVSAVAAAALFESSLPSGVLVWGYGLVLSVAIDVDHFVVARLIAGDWSHLRRAVANPRILVIDQERVFPDIKYEIEPGRLLSHALLGGALTVALAVLAPTLAVFTAVVLYAHVVCDLLRDTGLA